MLVTRLYLEKPYVCGMKADQKISFKTWIDRDREPSESFSRSLQRCSLATQVSMPTLWKASKGHPVTAKIAFRLSRYTRGEVSPGDLAIGQHYQGQEKTDERTAT